MHTLIYSIAVKDNKTPAYHRDNSRPPTLLEMTSRTMKAHILEKKLHQSFCVFAKPQYRRKKTFKKL